MIRNRSGRTRSAGGPRASQGGSLGGTVNTTTGLAIDGVAGVTAFRCHNGSNSTPGTDAANKITTGEITNWAFYGGATDNTTFSTPGMTLSWTTATGGNGTIPAGDNAATMRSINCGTSEAGVQCSVTADTTTRKVRVYTRSFTVSGNAGVKCRATLADSSAGPIVLDQTVTNTNTYFEFTYSAATTTTMLLQLFPETLSAGSQVAYGAVTWGT